MIRGKVGALINDWFAKRFRYHVFIVVFLWEVGTRSYTGAVNNSKVPLLLVGAIGYKTKPAHAAVKDTSWSNI